MYSTLTTKCEWKWAGVSATGLMGMQVDGAGQVTGNGGNKRGHSGGKREVAGCEMTAAELVHSREGKKADKENVICV